MSSHFGGHKLTHRIAHELIGQLTKANKTWTPDAIPAALLREIIVAVEEGKITGSTGRNVLKHVLSTGSAGSLDELLSALGVTPSSADDLRALCDAVIAKLPKEADKVRKGNDKVVMRLVGEVMKVSKGTADAKAARELLLDILRAR